MRAEPRAERLLVKGRELGGRRWGPTHSGREGRQRGVIEDARGGIEGRDVVPTCAQRTDHP